MVEIFALNIQDIQQDTVGELIGLIQIEKAEKILNYRQIEDTYRSLFGELIIRYAICLKFGCSNDGIKISIKGKPHLLSPSNIHFNISHSGEWVLGAIANNPIGIDIEFINENRDFEKIVQRFFTEVEKEYIFSGTSYTDVINRFYQLWTLKESYIKADGRGLLLPMRSFTIIPRNDDISIETKNYIKNCKFRSYKLDEEYVGAICSLDDNISYQVEVLSVNEIMKFFK